MGGYNMAMVDEFLDELTEDYTALYKENAALKTKLKVMVDKVEEYRATEDSMRAALLTAQKMAENLVAEAEAKKAELLKDVDATIRQRQEELSREVAQEEQRLENAKAKVAAFLEKSRALCQEQLSALDHISQEELTPAAVSVPVVEEVKQEETAAAIEESLRSAFSMSFSSAFEKDEAEEAKEEPATIVETVQEVVSQPSEPLKEEDADSIYSEFHTTRRINISELKFGRNYDSND
jgi:cell division initiation protein